MLSADDIVANQSLLADYGHVVDDHDWDRAHEVFAQDFVFERADGRPDLHGIADVVATFRGRNMYARHRRRARPLVPARRPTRQDSTDSRDGPGRRSG